MDEHGDVAAGDKIRVRTGSEPSGVWQEVVPVQDPAEEHGDLRADERHHGGRHQVGGGENAINDRHAGEEETIRTRTWTGTRTMTRTSPCIAASMKLGAVKALDDRLLQTQRGGASAADPEPEPESEPTHLNVSTCLESCEHEHEAEAEDDDVQQLLPVWTHPGGSSKPKLGKRPAEDRK